MAVVEAQPIIMDDPEVELNGETLKCLASHVGLVPDVTIQTATTFCGEVDHPGVVKWNFNLTVYQSFDEGGTDEVLQKCLEADGPVPYRIVPRGSRPVSATNPAFVGEVIPRVYAPLEADAGAFSEVTIEWSMTGPPTREITPGSGNGGASLSVDAHASATDPATAEMTVAP